MGLIAGYLLIRDGRQGSLRILNESRDGSSGQLLSISEPDGVYCYFIDAMQNVIGITKEDGTREWYDYQPAGEDVTTSTTAYNPYRYKSTYRDDVNGKVLYYMINRYYDPVHGRFTQIDPIKEIAEFAEFAFAGNNPILYSDPIGLCYFYLDCLGNRIDSTSPFPRSIKVKSRAISIPTFIPFAHRGEIGHNAAKSVGAFQMAINSAGCNYDAQSVLAFAMTGDC